MLTLPDKPFVIVDIEASGLFPDDGARLSCIGLRWEGGSVCLPFDQGERDKFPTATMTLWDESDSNLGRDVWEYLFDWLAGRDLGFHNAKYDLRMLETGTRHWPGRDLTANLAWDSLLTQKQLDPTEDVGLDKVGVRLELGGKTGKDELKWWLKKKKYATHRYDLVPWSIMEEYLQGDIDLTWELVELQRRRIADPEEEFDNDRRERELLTLRTLYAMESRGVGYDVISSLDAAEAMEAYANEVELTMPFPATPNGAKDWFCNKQGLKTDRVTEKGKPSIDEEQIRKWKQIYAGTHPEFVSDLHRKKYQWAAEYERVSKLRRAVSMWYRGYPEKAGADGRLRCYYKQTEVKSGRMSVQRVQLQAIPKADKALTIPNYNVPHVRWLLRAREGHGLWNLDLSQAELRVAAKYCGCQTMLDMLLGGTDFHGETCKGTLEASPEDADWKEKRDIAKRLTFGSIFQIGGEKFQATLAKLADVHWELEKCEAAVHSWRSMYPEFQRAYYKSMRLFDRRGYVTLLPHTPYEMRSYRGPRDFENTGWNRIVQGSLAEALRLWLVEVEKKWPGYMVLTVHDSVVLEAPLDEGDDLAAEVAVHTGELMTELFGVPMLCDHERYKTYVQDDSKEWVLG